MRASAAAAETALGRKRNRSEQLAAAAADDNDIKASLFHDENDENDESHFKRVRAETINDAVSVSSQRKRPRDGPDEQANANSLDPGARKFRAGQHRLRTKLEEPEPPRPASRRRGRAEADRHAAADGDEGRPPPAKSERMLGTSAASEHRIDSALAAIAADERATVVHLDNARLGQLHLESRARSILQAHSCSGPHSIFAQAPPQPELRRQLQTRAESDEKAHESWAGAGPAVFFHRLDGLPLADDRTNRDGVSMMDDVHSRAPAAAAAAAEAGGSWCSAPAPALSSKAPPTAAVPPLRAASDAMHEDVRLRVRAAWQQWHAQQAHHMALQQNTAAQFDSRHVATAASTAADDEDAMSIERY
jgi:hypothetical protein